MKRKGLLAVVFLIVAMTLFAHPGYAGTGGKTRDDAVRWANAQIGLGLDYDGRYGAQCVDLIAYYYRYLGQPVAFGNANEYVNGGKFTPSGWSYQSSPQPGDIAVWTHAPHGHVAIVTAVSGNNMTVVEQNYNAPDPRIGSPGSTRSISISRSGVRKYIRPDFPNSGSSQTASRSGTEKVVNRYYKRSEYDEGNYSGEWKNGAPNGFGRHTYDDKYDGASYKFGDSHALYYEGEFVDGRRIGKGKVVYENGVQQIGRFFGAWQAGKKIFEGRYYYPDGDIYEGYLMATSGVSSKWVDATVSEAGLYDSAPQPQKKTYTISYDANGGFGAPSSQSKTEGESIYLTSSTPYRVGYVFRGWSKSRSAVFCDYFEGSSYSEDGDQTLYAVWDESLSSSSSSSTTTTQATTTTTAPETTTQPTTTTESETTTQPTTTTAENLTEEDEEQESVTREVEPNNKLTEANRIETDTMITGSLLKSSDDDWYTFTLPEDGVISITFGNEYVDSNRTYWKTRIYNSNNDQLKVNEWVGNKLEDRESKKLGLPAGTYYLKVEDYNFTGNEYHFTVNYEESENWEKEFNNTPVTANSISPNREIHGTLVDGNDDDWYRFTLPEDGFVSILFGNEYVNGNGTYWKTRIYNNNNEQLKVNAWTGDKLEDRENRKIGLPAGTYYLKVEDYNFTGNEYYFTVQYEESENWEKEINNTPVKANKIPLDTEVNGSLSDSGDRDWYEFVLPDDGTISLTFGNEYYDSGWTYWQTTLFDGKKKEIKGFSWKANELTDRTTEKIGLNAGKYYLFVEDYDFIDNEYHFTVNLNPVEKKEQKTEKKTKKTEERAGRKTSSDYVSPHFERVNVYYLDQFSDVPSDQWYTKNVAEVFELGLMKGNGGSFKPYGDVTVAEAVTLASRIHCINENGSENFVQSPKEWYRVYLDYALKNKIIEKAVYNSEVSHRINRSQFAAILSKTLPDECFEPINEVRDDAIPDVSMSDRYAADIYKLYRAGILSGSDANGTFNPSTYITRAEAAAIISRIVESENRVKINLD